MTASLGMIGIDCADPGAMAEFYSQVLGWPILGRAERHAMIQSEGGLIIAFYKIDDYRPPTWPEATTPKQFHLDVMVTDLDAAEARCLELGATKASHQPGTYWRVLLDPAGHPFCVTNPQ